MFQGYEFIGLKGSTGKMSGSSGLNLTPETLFRIYQPEIILWLYAKTDPLKAFNFCFDEDILRQYYEFDRSYTAYEDGSADERTKDAVGLSVIKGREVQPVSMQQLVSFGSIVDFVPELLETVFEKIGTPYNKDEFAERLGLAKHWLTNYSPESVNRLLEGFDSEYFNALSIDEQSELVELRKYLANETYSIDELQSHLYAVPAIVRGEISDSAEKKKMQAAFFKNVYRLLLGKDRGPRLYLFLFALEKEQFLNLLPLSTNS
jgi:lysyl-tRNA synthetase class 1